MDYNGVLERGRNEWYWIHFEGSANRTFDVLNGIFHGIGLGEHINFYPSQNTLKMNKDS